MFKFDVSIPVEEMYPLVEYVRNQLNEFAYVGGYGHIGDGNLHLNIAVPPNTEKGILELIHSELEPLIYEKVSELKGSISAEHGIGYLKAGYMKYTKSAGALNKMIEIKKPVSYTHLTLPTKRIV